MSPSAGARYGLWPAEARRNVFNVRPRIFAHVSPRKTRTVPSAIRRALSVGDTRCQSPGCSARLLNGVLGERAARLSQ